MTERLDNDLKLPDLVGLFLEFLCFFVGDDSDKLRFKGDRVAVVVVGEEVEAFAEAFAVAVAVAVEGEG